MPHSAICPNFAVALNLVTATVALLLDLHNAPTLSPSIFFPRPAGHMTMLLGAARLLKEREN
jgi:hypothetical protein